MKKLLNTLYVTSEDAYLSLDGENVIITIDCDEKHRIPLHTLESIISFSYKGASPALMGKCVNQNIQLSFYSPYGKYWASVNGSTNGNVLLRREQYRIADNEEKSLDLAKVFICGKLYNSRYLLLKFARDYELRIDTDALRDKARMLKDNMTEVRTATSKEQIRGIEGSAAADYFEVFDSLILQNKNDFKFYFRNRRPPVDNVNALLSLSYTLLANDCAAALAGVGLDPYVGFLHVDRPGRRSLALDLMEELRSVYADRFVLTLINNRIVSGEDFDEQESGAVLLTEDGRKRFLMEWQKKKKESLRHPFLEEKVFWGLVPHVQAMLLARYLRGDLDNYPPFFWK
ncbi:MAG TPA: type I-C CRISPR-associated endonuclease Cas1 [Mogibacterium sp.]|nr:type I-C CRISPR-associated endonuclease Cas1 [Mogibacterium sp.]